MLKPGTFCYVLPSCRASPAARRAIGRVVEVTAGPFGRSSVAGEVSYYHVSYRQLILSCRADKLRAINDPDVDVGEPQDGLLA